MKPLLEAKFVKLQSMLGLLAIGGLFREHNFTSLMSRVVPMGGCWNLRLCRFITPIDLLEIVSR